MKVPFADSQLEYREVKDDIDAGLQNIFEKGNFVLGDEVNTFEREFAEYCGVRYAVGVNSGTDALYLALSALNIGPGDEVLLPTHTFIATALCVTYTGAKPVFVDVEPQTLNIDPQKIEEAITPKTKAILVVHLYGQSADMDAINAIAQKYDLKVVEDACQAHGAYYNGQRVGSLGDIGCFSFYPTKSLGAFGDAGMIVSDNGEVEQSIKLLRDYGRQTRYEHKIKGFNSRLDTIQAAVLSVKLRHLDQWNQMRVQNANYYFELLENITEVGLPTVKENRTHVFQTFCIRVPNRDAVLNEMKKQGVDVSIHYPVPIHLQEAYSELGYSRGDFPVAEKAASEIMSLPMFPHISREQIEYVCHLLKESLGVYA